jgi:hypothetical protein
VERGRSVRSTALVVAHLRPSGAGLQAQISQPSSPVAKPNSQASVQTTGEHSGAGLQAQIPQPVSSVWKPNSQ